MIFWLIKESLFSLLRHKLRSFFAVVGVMVGISAVIVLVSIGKGVEKDVTSTVEGIGTNLIVIVAGKIDASSNGFSSGGFGNPANFISGDILKREDVDEIKKIDGVKAIAPLILVAGNVRFNDKSASVTPLGSSSDVKDVFTGFKLKNGRFFQDADLNKNVMVAGEGLKTQLFSDKENIIGEKTMINKEEFEIIGQLEKPSNSGQLFSSDYESLVIIPLDTAKRLNGGKDKILRIGVTATSADSVNDTVNKIKENMLLRHKDDEFSVLTQEDLLGLFNSIIKIITTAVTAIAAISLIVGGIGISSVMFMSVADRTREIGIRKALGATSAIIMFQFLVESVVLAIFGGIFGLLLAYLVNYIIDLKTVITPSVSISTILLALAFCSGVGILFGLIPASRAASKDPVEALRQG